MNDTIPVDLYVLKGYVANYDILNTLHVINFTPCKDIMH